MYSKLASCMTASECWGSSKGLFSEAFSRPGGPGSPTDLLPVYMVKTLWFCVSLMKQPCRVLSFNCLPRIPRRNLDGAHLGSAGKGWLLRRWLESRRPRLLVKICSRRGCPQEFVSRFVPSPLLTEGTGKGSRASRARHSSAWPPCLPPSLAWVLAMRYGAGAFSFFQEKGKLNIDYQKCWYLSLNKQAINAPKFLEAKALKLQTKLCPNHGFQSLLESSTFSLKFKQILLLRVLFFCKQKTGEKRLFFFLPLYFHRNERKLQFLYEI